MAKIHQTLSLAVLSTVCLVTLTPTVASSNPLSVIDEIVKQIHVNIDKTKSTIESAKGVIDKLNRDLGIGNGTQGNSIDPTKAVLDSYATWYSRLSSSEQEIVSQLVLEAAKGKAVTLDVIAASEWFLQKPSREQQKVAALLLKLNRIIEVVGPNKQQFFAFALCVNSGAQNCLSATP